MSQESAAAADRWADRALVVAGFVTGGIVGVFEAPNLQNHLGRFGVDQLSFKPALPIILGFAIFGARLAYPRRKRARNLAR